MATSYSDGTTSSLLATFLNMAAKPEGGTAGIKYAGKDYFIPGYYLGYLGVVCAFVLPTLGALEAASTSLTYIQDGFLDFYSQYTVY